MPSAARKTELGLIVRLRQPNGCMLRKSANFLRANSSNIGVASNIKQVMNSCWPSRPM